MAYFKNTVFDTLFIERMNCTDEGRLRKIEHDMANMIIAMVKNFIRHPFFNGYPEHFKTDLIGEGVTAIWSKLNSFDIEKGRNYFAYFTAIAKNAFVAKLRIYYNNKNMNIPMDAIENFLTEED